MMKKLGISSIRWAGVSVLSLTVMSAAAQDAGQLQRLLEQTMPPAFTVPPQEASLQLSDTPWQEVQRLEQVRILGGPRASQMQAYWRNALGQAVSASQLQAFWAWAQAQLRVQGFVAEVQLEVLPGQSGGQLLQVSVVVPKVRRVSVVVPDPQLAERYRDLISSRVLAGIELGAELNMHALDQRLEMASHDVPLSLEAVLRPAGPALMDVHIHVRPSSLQQEGGFRPWVQANNHGLSAYGRAQMVGAWAMPGLLPSSTASVTLQASEGVKYVRAEQEALATVLGGRWSVWGSRSDSRTLASGSTASLAVSDELGLGLTHLFAHWDDLLWQSRLEVVRRHASSRLRQSDLLVSDVQDSQLRWRWSLDNERLLRDALRLDAMVVWGNNDRNIGSAASLGRFTRVELSGRQQGRLDHAGRWLWRWQAKAQWGQSNLDSYHRMALGGLQAVRAYTSADGVGDRGGVASLDVQYSWSFGQRVGVFYDAGRIKPWLKAPAGVFNDSYSLQAVGLTWQAQVGSASLQTSLAKGMGGYRKAQAGELTESKPNPLRLNMALSYSF